MLTGKERALEADLRACHIGVFSELSGSKGGIREEESRRYPGTDAVLEVAT